MEKMYQLTEKQALRDPWEEVVEMCREAWGDLGEHASLDWGYEMHLADGKSYYEYMVLHSQDGVEPLNGNALKNGLNMCLRLMLDCLRRSHGSVKWIPGDPVKYLLFVRPTEERPKFVRAVKETS